MESNLAPQNVLLVGDSTRAEFRDILPLLEADTHVRRAPELNATTSTALDLCVLLQATPEEFPIPLLEDTLRRWPLTRFIAVAGSLAEGEPRTGRPWPGQVRVYWHEFPGWWALQQARLRAGHLPEWALPRTSRDEDVLRQLPPVTFPRLTGPIGIATARWGSAAALLLDMLRVAGVSGCRIPVDRRAEIVGLQAIIWDDDDPDFVWRDVLLKLRSLWPSTPLVALRNFPRVDDRTWMKENLGNETAVLAKPFDVEVLLATLDSLVAPSARILI